MPKTFHVQARQQWEPFEYNGEIHTLNHLNAHEVIFSGGKKAFAFIVTYGLHCFTKDRQKSSLPIDYCDGHECRAIHLKRYHLSKQLRSVIEGLGSGAMLFHTTQEKFFTFEQVDQITGEIWQYKVCFCAFKENRKLRIHVTSAFLDDQKPQANHKKISVFKLAMDLEKKPRKASLPKEATRK